MRETYEECLRVAGAVCRSRHDAPDLVQTVLLEALEHGVHDLAGPERRAWLRRALRKRAPARRARNGRGGRADRDHSIDAFALGPARAELIASLRRRRCAVLASHNPDGHPLLFSVCA
jgi:DNA-directed RNA polymerase specialized sigma24 family protein